MLLRRGQGTLARSAVIIIRAAQVVRTRTHHAMNVNRILRGNEYRSYYFCFSSSIRLSVFFFFFLNQCLDSGSVQTYVWSEWREERLRRQIQKKNFIFEFLSKTLGQRGVISIFSPNTHIFIYPVRDFHCDVQKKKNNSFASKYASRQYPALSQRDL